MLTRRSETKFKDYRKKDTFKYTVWYKNIMSKDNKCVIVLVMLYETIATNTVKLLRVLSCIVYSIINNYVCIDYLSCQYKKLSVICYCLTY